MMPDKIYLNKHMLRRGMLYPAQYPADAPEEEYIRKDVLLEWAKETKEIMSLGGHVSIDDIISKIESL